MYKQKPRKNGTIYILVVLSKLKKAPNWQGFYIS